MATKEQAERIMSIADQLEHEHERDQPLDTKITEAVRGIVDEHFEGIKSLNRQLQEIHDELTGDDQSDAKSKVGALLKVFEDMPLADKIVAAYEGNWKAEEADKIIDKLVSDLTDLHIEMVDEMELAELN
jgi:hypothetical protein